MKYANILHLVLAIYLIHYSNALFGKKYLKKLKEKAKDYYKTQFGKKGLNFLGYELSEYPGANKKYRDENRAKWDEYYECLNLQAESLGEHRSLTPEAFQSFEGGSIRFECKICISPQERDKIDTVEWYWGKIISNYLVPVDFTEHVVVSPEDKALHLYNLKEENSGQYICRVGQTMTAPYYLTVKKNIENLTEVHPQTAPKGPYPRPITVLHSLNIKVDVIWDEWSPCSRCGRAGKRHKLGYCIVLPMSVDEEPKRKTEHSSKVDKHNIKKRDVNKQTNKGWNHVTESHFIDGLSTIAMDIFTSAAYLSCKKNSHVTVESSASTLPEKHSKEIVLTKNYTDLIQIFKYGIPCESHILPKIIKELPEVQNKTGEIMIGYCKEKCPKSNIFEVKDKKGKVLETANNTAGIYSMLQPIPPPEPSVKRTIEYHIKGDKIKLSCPGNLNSDYIISWQIGSKNVIPDLIAADSKGRIYISLTDKIHIKDARLSDTNYYSCWQNKELAGSIRLVVENKVRLNFNHHIMLFGIVIILSTFVYVFIRVFFTRKYAKLT